MWSRTLVLARLSVAVAGPELQAAMSYNSSHSQEVWENEFKASGALSPDFSHQEACSPDPQRL